MTLYDRIADLPVQIESVDLELLERETSSQQARTTTHITLHGDGTTGTGEDVTYTNDAHYQLVSDADLSWLPGEYSFDDLSATLADQSLFPIDPPERDVFRNYRQWGFESAALDLALAQADTNLGTQLDRDYHPVRFVVSTRLGDPARFDRIETLLSINPDLEFKLDPTSDWADDLLDALAATRAVRILDFKGHYTGTSVDQPPDPDLYERVLAAFPDAIIEDPALTDDTTPLLTDHYPRVSFDAPVTSVPAIRSLPVSPNWLNIKPSRFGTINSLLDAIEYCESSDITMYGGGQFELGVGRAHLHTLASLFYPTSPSDIAPRRYNEPALGRTLPTSPLSLAESPIGMDWPRTAT